MTYNKEESIELTTAEILGFLRSSKTVADWNVVKTFLEKDSALLLRIVNYLMNKESKHRNTMAMVLLASVLYASVPKTKSGGLNGEKTINYTSSRNVAWQLFVDFPLSYTLEIIPIIESLPKKEKNKVKNCKRLRLALAVKLAKSSNQTIIRAYFFSPVKFRKFFSYFYLPRTKIDLDEKEGKISKEIINESYLLAAKLSELTESGKPVLSSKDVAKDLNLTPAILIKNYGLTIHKVIDLLPAIGELEDPDEHIKLVNQMIELAHLIKADQFFELADTFKNILGTDRFEDLALKIVNNLENPQHFTTTLISDPDDKKQKITIKEHLQRKGAFSPKLINLLDKRTEEFYKRMIDKFELKEFAVVIDVSSSMQEARDITDKLMSNFPYLKDKVDLWVAFNHAAWSIAPEEIMNLSPFGSTSIGSALQHVYSQIQSSTIIPSFILLVTDFEETSNPRIHAGIQLLKTLKEPPPLITILCGRYKKMYLYNSIAGELDYPMGVIEINEFHNRLVADIIKEIALLTSKVVVKERQITEIVKTRTPIEELIGKTKLRAREVDSLKKNYLGTLLTQL